MLSAFTFKGRGEFLDGLYSAQESKQLLQGELNAMNTRNDDLLQLMLDLNTDLVHMMKERNDALGETFDFEKKLSEANKKNENLADEVKSLRSRNEILESSLSKEDLKIALKSNEISKRNCLQIRSEKDDVLEDLIVLKRSLEENETANVTSANLTCTAAEGIFEEKNNTFENLNIEKILLEAQKENQDLIANMKSLELDNERLKLSAKSEKRLREELEHVKRDLKESSERAALNEKGMKALALNVIDVLKAADESNKLLEIYSKKVQCERKHSPNYWQALGEEVINRREDIKILKSKIKKSAHEFCSKIRKET